MWLPRCCFAPHATLHDHFGARSKRRRFDLTRAQLGWRTPASLGLKGISFTHHGLSTTPSRRATDKNSIAVSGQQYFGGAPVPDSTDVAVPSGEWPWWRERWRSWWCSKSNNIIGNSKYWWWRRWSKSSRNSLWWTRKTKFWWFRYRHHRISFIRHPLVFLGLYDIINK